MKKIVSDILLLSLLVLGFFTLWLLKNSNSVHDVAICGRRNYETETQFEKSSFCNLCKNKWLFIIGTGRSGSTTALDMVNSIPNSFLSGETGGAIGFMHQLPYFSGNPWKKQFIFEKENIGPFEHRKVPQHALLCSLQNYFIDLIQPTAREAEFGYIGFKTIRVLSAPLLDFMKELFPCAKFLINYRNNITAQHFSKFQAKISVDTLKAETNEIKQWMNENRHATFDLPLEAFSVETFNSMLTWLGYQDCTFLRVVHANNHSFKADYNTSVQGSCQLQKILKSGSVGV